MTFAYSLPTFRDMNRIKRSNYETLSVGNVTVKIYQRRRPTAMGKFRVIHEVADYTSGTRILRSFSDHKEARDEAMKIARQLACGESTAAAVSNRDAASYGRAIELLKPTGVALELAAGHFSEAFKILGGDKVVEAAKFFARHKPDQVEQKRIADVVAELVALKQSRGLSVDYTKDLRQRLTRFAKDFGQNISDITTGDVQRWLDGLKLGPQSIKNFRTVLHTFFDFAESRGYIIKGGNPVVDTENVKVNGGNVEIFTTEEIGKLLKGASADFLPMVAIGAFAGLRTAELERLEWCDVDFASGFITVARDKAKTKARRLVPIQTNLAKWLADYKEHKGLIWQGTENDLQDARAECVKASGVPWKDNALRHSYASYRLADTQNAGQLALEMGNSPEMVFKHYRELVKPDAAKAWFGMVPQS